MRARISRTTVALVAALCVSGGWAVTASAATDGHAVVAHAVVLVPAGSIFSKIVGAVLGAFSWTVGVAGKFILVTLASLVRMLIPRSWARVPVEVFQWIVAVPNFAGTITSPSGQTEYGFAGVNAMRELLEWIGIAFLPLTLTWAGGRAIFGAGDRLAAPVVRLLGLAGVLVFYPFLWGQGAALVDQVTHLILSPPAVTDGIRQLMAYAVEGVSLGGWQLVDLALMGAIALELLALIFVKVVVVLVGAILYATGPLLIGLIPTETGSRIARAWGGAAVALLLLPVVWAVIFAIGAVLIGDTSSAGPLVGGSSTVEQLLGSVIVAIAGVATLWLCLRASREAASMFRGQLGMLAPAVASLRRGSHRAVAPAARARSAGGPRAASVRGFQQHVRTAASAAGSAGPAGRRAAGIGGGVAQVGRRGLVVGGASLAGRAARAGVSAARSSRPGASAPTRSASQSGTAKTRSARGVVSNLSRRAGSPWRGRRPRQPGGSPGPGPSQDQPTRTPRPEAPENGTTVSRPAPGSSPLGTVAGDPRDTTPKPDARQPSGSPARRASARSSDTTGGQPSAEPAAPARSPSRRGRRKPTEASDSKPTPSPRPVRSPRSDPEGTGR